MESLQYFRQRYVKVCSEQSFVQFSCSSLCRVCIQQKPIPAWQDEPLLSSVAATPHGLYTARGDLLVPALSVNFVGYGELFATFGATSSEHAATIGCEHALTETVLVVSFAIVRLKSSFHCLFCFYYLL